MCGWVQASVCGADADGLTLTCPAVFSQLHGRHAQPLFFKCTCQGCHGLRMHRPSDGPTALVLYIEEPLGMLPRGTGPACRTHGAAAAGHAVQEGELQEHPLTPATKQLCYVWSCHVTQGILDTLLM